MSTIEKLQEAKLDLVDMINSTDNEDARALIEEDLYNLDMMLLRLERGVPVTTDQAYLALHIIENRRKH